MIPKVICWLWGHKFWIKAHTGEALGLDPIGRTIYAYRWEKQKFCLRCNKEPFKLVE